MIHSFRPAPVLWLALVTVFVLVACSGSEPSERAGVGSDPIVERTTACPNYYDEAGTRIVWTDSRTEEMIWLDLCGPVTTPTTSPIPMTTTTTIPPATTVITQNTTTTTNPQPTTTTTSPVTTTTTLLLRSLVCPGDRARAGEIVYWSDERSQGQVMAAECGLTTTTAFRIPEQDERSWRWGRYEDPVTQQPVVQAARDLGDASLLFTCPPANILEITIWGEEVPGDSSLDQYKRARVSYRIGGTVVEGEIWDMRRQDGRYLLVVPKSLRGKVIRLFRDRSLDEFIVSTALPGLPDDQLFDLTGFESAVEPVLEACGW